MGIMLEVKKFINSEYVGEFTEIELPIEAAPIEDKKSKSKKAAGKKANGRRFKDDDDDDMDEEEYEERREEYDEEPSFERVRIHYVEEGVGEPLILVHTIGQSIYTWRNLFNRLSLNYRVIAVDLVGHGYSGRPLNFGYTIEEQAKALELFMDAIGIRSAHFLAFSMGSAYALRLALEHPERIGKMVLMAPGGMSDEMPMPVKLLDSSFFGGIAAMLYNLRTVEKVLSDCYFDLTVGLKEEVIGEYYKTISDKESRRAIRESLHNFEDEDIVRNLRVLDVPVLIIQGSEDKWRTAELAETYHAAMPYAGFATVRNAGHLLHEEKPERVISAMLEYIPAVQPEV